MHTRPSLKSLIELKISEKIPTAFQSKKISKSYFSRTGIKEIDSLLDGIPYGEFTEITGETSCGSTTLVLSFLAEITQKQQLGAFVDPSNSLDIESCSTVGINLNQLLWVRFGQKEQKLWEKLEQALKVTDLLLHNRGFGAVVLDLRGLPINFPQRIPPTTWFRFSQIVRDSETALVLLSRKSYSKSAASLVLDCYCLGDQWTKTGQKTEELRISTFNGLDFGVNLLRRQPKKTFSPSNIPKLPSETIQWKTRFS